MLTRRQLILGSGAMIASGTGLGGYAYAIEPYRLAVRNYSVRPRRWPRGLNLRIAAIADLQTLDADRASIGDRGADKRPRC